MPTEAWCHAVINLGLGDWGFYAEEECEAYTLTNSPDSGMRFAAKLIRPDDRHRHYLARLGELRNEVSYEGENL
jgi:hypothetical protein